MSAKTKCVHRRAFQKASHTLTPATKELKEVRDAVSVELTIIKKEKRREVITSTGSVLEAHLVFQRPAVTHTQRGGIKPPSAPTVLQIASYLRYELVDFSANAQMIQGYKCTLSPFVAVHK